jgi:hypothetical protein
MSKKDLRRIQKGDQEAVNWDEIESSMDKLLLEGDAGMDFSESDDDAESGAATLTNFLRQSELEDDEDEGGEAAGDDDDDDDEEEEEGGGGDDGDPEGEEPLDQEDQDYPDAAESDEDNIVEDDQDEGEEGEQITRDYLGGKFLRSLELDPKRKKARDDDAVDDFASILELLGSGPNAAPEQE